MDETLTRFWYVPALAGRTPESDARTVPHELGPGLAARPPAGQLIATVGNGAAPAGAAAVDVAAAEMFFGTAWTQAARRAAAWRGHDRTPAATILEVGAAVEAFIRSVRRRSGRTDWIGPAEDGRDEIAGRRIAVHPEAPQHADLAPRGATVAVRAAGGLQLLITALGDSAPRIEYREGDGARRVYGRHHPDLARAVAEAADGRNDLRPLAIRSDTLLDAARLLAGEPRPLWVAVRDRNGEIATRELNPEAAVTTLAEVLHPATRGDDSAGWRVDVRDRNGGRFVIEDAAGRTRGDTRRPYRCERDESLATGSVRELIERIRERRAELDYRWSGSAAQLELIEMAAASHG